MGRFHAIVSFLLHVLAGVYEFLIAATDYLHAFAKASYKKFVRETDFVKEYRKLRKIPKHLTVLVEKPEECDLIELSDFIIWALKAGIPYISFYDKYGYLKKRVSEFREESERRKGDSNVIWHGDEGGGYKNGFIGPKIHVKLLSETDGRIRVAETCKELAQTESSENIDINRIDVMLKKYFEFPNPELGVYFGRSFNLRDYPPWQITVTEFINIPDNRWCDQTEFLRCLRRYNRCEQRFGK